MANPSLRISVAEYRDMTRRLLTLVDDWSACVDCAEVALWHARAAGFYAGFEMIQCSRASARDVELRTLAQERYQDLIAPLKPAAQSFVAPSPVVNSRSRAGTYNASPGRAVRMARAARSAMRRGYF